MTGRERGNGTVNRPAPVADGSEAEVRRFTDDSFGFASRMLAVRDGFAQHLGLSGPQYSILSATTRLAEHGPVNISTLAEHLRLSGSFITTETNKLSEQGLITKKPDRQDRRRVLIAVTAKGHRRLDGLVDLQAAVDAAGYRTLTRHDFDELRRIMPQLVEAADRALDLLPDRSEPRPPR